MKERKELKIAIVFLLSICIVFGGIYFSPMETVKAVTLNNPRKDSNGKVTYDCVWFGSYPQAEVIPSGKYEALDSGLLQVGDTIISDAIYNKLKNAIGWNANGDIILEGNKYRRIRQVDVAYSSDTQGYYSWLDSNSYHYFKYEPIKWRILKVNGTDAFLVADKSLENQKYNDSYTSVIWQTSTIRSWLNGYSASSNADGKDYSNKNFIDTAFSSSERTAINSASIVNDDNLNYGIEGGNNTNDKIFLLSESEVYTNSAVPYGFKSSYSIYDETRRSKSSTYGKATGIYSDTSDEYKGNCYTWLRSPGGDMYSITYVYTDGSVSRYGCHIDYHRMAVRPVLHLNLDSIKQYCYAGTVCSDGSIKEEGKKEIEQEESKSTIESTQKKNQIILAKSCTKKYGSKLFSLNVKTNGDGKLTYKSSNNKVVKISSTGKVTIKGCGKATIIVNASETSNYKAATKKITITVKPKQGRLSKVRSLKKETVKIVWKKLKGITGYQIQISKNKKFKKGVLQRYFLASQTSIAVPLKKESGKKYYVRIRAYKIVKGKDYYGKWSRVKTVKVK